MSPLRRLAPLCETGKQPRAPQQLIGASDRVGQCRFLLPQRHTTPRMLMPARRPAAAMDDPFRCTRGQLSGTRGAPLPAATHRSIPTRRGHTALRPRHVIRRRIASDRAATGGYGRGDEAASSARLSSLAGRATSAHGVSVPHAPGWQFPQFVRDERLSSPPPASVSRHYDGARRREADLQTGMRPRNSTCAERFRNVGLAPADRLDSSNRSLGDENDQERRVGLLEAVSRIVRPGETDRPFRLSAWSVWSEKHDCLPWKLGRDVRQVHAAVVPLHRVRERSRNRDGRCQARFRPAGGQQQEGGERAAHA